MASRRSISLPDLGGLFPEPRRCWRGLKPLMTSKAAAPGRPPRFQRPGAHPGHPGRRPRFMATPEEDVRLRLQEASARAAFNGWLGLEVDHAADGEVELSLPWRPEFGQYSGYLHAGIVAGLIDTACGFAASTLSGRVLASQLSHPLPAAGRRRDLRRAGPGDQARPSAGLRLRPALCPRCAREAPGERGRRSRSDRLIAATRGISTSLTGRACGGAPGCASCLSIMVGQVSIFDTTQHIWKALHPHRAGSSTGEAGTR